MGDAGRRRATMRPARVLYAVALAFLALWAASAPAQASAWGQAKGAGFASANVERFSNGAGAYRRTDADLYLEYGLTRRITIGAQTLFGRASSGAGDEAVSNFGAFAVEAFVQSQLWRGQNSVVAVRTTMSAPAYVDEEARFALRDPGFDLETRALWGRGFSTPFGHAFANVEAAHRTRFGPAASQVRIDATLGLQPNKRWMLLAQSFNIVSLRNETLGGADYDVYKLQPSAVWFATQRLGLQTGATIEVAGRNLTPGVSAFAGVWVRF